MSVLPPSAVAGQQSLPLIFSTRPATVDVAAAIGPVVGAGALVEAQPAAARTAPHEVRAAPRAEVHPRPVHNEPGARLQIQGDQLTLVVQNGRLVLPVLREQTITCRRCPQRNEVPDPKTHGHCQNCGEKLPLREEDKPQPIEREHLAVGFMQVFAVEDSASLSAFSQRFKPLIDEARRISERHAIRIKYLNDGKFMFVSGLGSEADDAQANLLILRQVIHEIQEAWNVIESDVRSVTSLSTGAGYQNDNDLFGSPVNKAQRQLQATLDALGDSSLEESMVVVAEGARQALSSHYSTEVHLTGVVYKGFEGTYAVHLLREAKAEITVPVVSAEEQAVVNPKCSQQDTHPELGEAHCVECGSAAHDPGEIDDGREISRVGLAIDMSGFTPLFAELGPKGVADQVGIFIDEIQYELAKEGVSINSVIHRAGDEIAFSIDAGIFAKALRAVMRAFRRLERRNPEIKLKAAFAALDLVEYKDGTKIGEVKIVQAAQESAKKDQETGERHGIVVHENLAHRISDNIITEAPEQKAGGPPDGNVLVEGIKPGASFVRSERFTPPQRVADGDEIHACYQEVEASGEFGVVVYVGDIDTGKAMGLLSFLNRLDLDRVRAMHGAGFRYQNDPLRNALYHHVASYDYDRLTSDALDTFWAELDFFAGDREFETTLEHPQTSVREIFADYIGVPVREESAEVQRLRKDAQKFVEAQQNIVAHVVRRMTTERPHVLVLFNLGSIRKDEAAQRLFSQVLEYNRDRPGMILGLEDRGFDEGDGRESAEQKYLEDLFGFVPRKSKVVVADSLNEAAVRQAIVDIYDKEIYLPSHPLEGGAADTIAVTGFHFLTEENVEDDVVEYYHRVSRGNTQILRAYLHYHHDQGVLVLDGQGQLGFSDRVPQVAESSSAVNAVLLSPLERLTPVARDVFDAVAMVGLMDGTFSGRELPQHASLGRDGLAMRLAELREKNLIADEGKGCFRVTNKSIQDAAVARLRRSAALVTRHGLVASHLERLPRRTARRHALLGFHQGRAGQIDQAIQSYEEAEKMAQARFGYEEALKYLDAQDGFAGLFSGPERVRYVATLLRRRIELLKASSWSRTGVGEEDPWAQAIDKYLALVDDASFGLLEPAEQAKIFLDGLFILPGERRLLQNHEEVAAAYYDQIKREQAAFLERVEREYPELMVEFHMRAMGAYQMVNDRENQRTADEHVQKALALMVGNGRDITIQDHERVFGSSLLAEGTELFARVCLNIGSRYSMHRGDFEAAEPYVRRAIELYDELGDRMYACYARITLGLNLNAQGRIEEAKEVLEEELRKGREAGDDAVSVANYALLHLSVSSIKEAEFAQAQRRFDEMLDAVANGFDYAPFVQDLTAHQAVAMALEDPEQLDGFLSTNVLDTETHGSFDEDSFEGRNRRQIQLFFSLFFAQALQGNIDEALRYLGYVLHLFESIGDAEDFYAEISWLRDHRDEMRAYLDAPSDYSAEIEEAPILIRSFFDRI